MKEKAKIFKIITAKIKKPYIVLTLAILVLAATLIPGLFWHEGYEAGPPHEKPKPEPSVSIGCDRVLWKDTELELAATTLNIDKPLFEWKVDDTLAGSNQKLSQKFDVGEHQVILNVVFDNRTLAAKQSIIVIDSVDSVSLHDSQASKNQWGFQTLYRGRSIGVKGVLVSVDSLPPSEVNTCGSLVTRALPAGKHTWRAEYQGVTIASGTFNLEEVSEIKITRIDVAPSYTAGETVDGKIVLKNTGTATVTGFDIKTLAVNNNYAWMGDIAKREYFNQYNSDIKPGEAYEIPIRITIPEKVSGIRPSGRYTITVNLILRGQTMDTKVVNTQVK